MNEINKEERMQGLSGQQVSESKAKYGTNELALVHVYRCI